MEKILEKLSDILENDLFIKANLSNRRNKDKDSYSKIDIEPVLVKNSINYQLTYVYKNKVSHENLNEEEFLQKLVELLEDFRQFIIYSVNEDIQVLISKKGKIKTLSHKPTKEKQEISHNRKKNYILNDGEHIDFLIYLGVMDKDGNVIKKRYNKFKQINRYLELVDDIISELDNKENINIVDFGCGKSYLTFALYYYLVKVRNLNVSIVGLDLKKDVINFCNKVSEDLDYKDLRFEYGDIKEYKSSKKIDMIVTLHACDNATDAALVQGIKWECDVILSVPCCQHEFYNKIDNSNLEPMLKHGIIRENLSTLVTDSLRSLFLETYGYNVQLVEFIDMKHTPKNILIRALKDSRVNKNKAKKEYKEFKKFWNLEKIFIEEYDKSF